MTDRKLEQRFDFEGHVVRFAASGEGRPLVLLHGAPHSSYQWHGISPVLAAQNRPPGAPLDHRGIEASNVLPDDFGGNGHLMQEDAPEVIVAEACAFFDLHGVDTGPGE